MNDRPQYENTFNHSAIINRRYRWFALASFLLAACVLAFHLMH